MSITNIETLAKLISTVQAAYGKLNFDLTNSLIFDANAKFTKTEAEKFVSTYSFVDQQENTSTGFSATVFQGNNGRKVLAFRGTEGSLLERDFLWADFGGILPHGFANDQSVDLFRYWKKLTAPAGKDHIYTDTELQTVFSQAR